MKKKTKSAKGHKRMMNGGMATQEAEMQRMPAGRGMRGGAAGPGVGSALPGVGGGFKEAQPQVMRGSRGGAGGPMVERPGRGGMQSMESEIKNARGSRGGMQSMEAEIKNARGSRGGMGGSAGGPMVERPGRAIESQPQVMRAQKVTSSGPSKGLRPGSRPDAYSPAIAARPARGGSMGFSKMPEPMERGMRGVPSSSVGMGAQPFNGLRGSAAGPGVGSALPGMGGVSNMAYPMGGAQGLGSSIGMKRGGVVKSKGKVMRGGGLARKGVGQALAKGGLAKRAGGCASRGVGRGKIV